MKLLKRTMTIVAAGALLVTLGLAQAKKPLVFHAKVEAVNTADNSLMLDGEKVDGWMDAMKMDYKVDNPAVLKNVKAGDKITATVYAGDMVLHKVQVDKK